MLVVLHINMRKTQFQSDPQALTVLFWRQIYVSLDHRHLFRCHNRDVCAVLGSPGKAPTSWDMSWRMSRGWEESFRKWRDYAQLYRHSLHGVYGVILGGWGREWNLHCVNLNAQLAGLRGPEQPEGHWTHYEGAGLCGRSKGVHPRCLTKR